MVTQTMIEQADEAFHAAVEKQFGKRAAGDMRYRNDKHNAETEAARLSYQLLVAKWRSQLTGGL